MDSHPPVQMIREWWPLGAIGGAAGRTREGNRVADRRLLMGVLADLVRNAGAVGLKLPPRGDGWMQESGQRIALDRIRVSDNVRDCDSRRAGADRCLTRLDGEAGGPHEDGALLVHGTDWMSPYPATGTRVRRARPRREGPRGRRFRVLR